MPITLKIVSYQRHTPGQQESFSTDRDKISIGRNLENDFPLPDPQRFMSGIHCWVEKGGDGWRLKDVSTNGVFINGSGDRIPKGDTVALSDGDRIKLGDYELEFAAQAAPVIQPVKDDSEDFFASTSPPDPRTQAPDRVKDVNTPLSQMDQGLLGDQVRLDELHDLGAPEEEEELPSIKGRETRGSPLRHHFRAPEVASESDDSAESLPDQYAVDPSDIPENWDVETGTWKPPEGAQPAKDNSTPGGVHIPDDWDEPTGIASAPSHQEREQPQAASESNPEPQPNLQPQRIRADSAFAAFMQGARLDASRVRLDDEATFFHDIGVLLRNMTEGIMQAMASRRQIKGEFRVEQTAMRPADNNPLKWGISVEDAMEHLVKHTESAYLKGPEAAREALEDLNAHQLAALAGTEAALRSILQRFKPANLETRLGGRSALGKLIPPLNKARNWEFYRALYSEVSEAADDDFQDLFGTEFRKAYEEQLDLIKKTRKEPSR